LAKIAFLVHGADSAGSVMISRQLRMVADFAVDKGFPVSKHLLDIMPTLWIAV